ncbi:MAG: 5-histidylcysteine sulfoxide synthase/putative 4-mercaptohistidine N1-methyltransferase [Paraglaciecola psychrophila]|jgi:5-histidylcysteine sulfoxide synthase/putative 4-mercaptohistidine N1-methyltranferase
MSPSQSLRRSMPSELVTEQPLFSSPLRTPRLNGDNVEVTRQAMAEYFNASWERYDSLFETLADDRAFFQKSISLRHPLIFYYGHTATFFINKLVLAGLIEHRINPGFESMFAIGVDEMGWDDLDEANYDWPTVAAVSDYRAKVRALINTLIETAPLTLPINWQHPWWTIIMGIEHEHIHLETSSVLIRQQNIDWLQSMPQWAPDRDSGDAPNNALVPIPAGSVTLGKSNDDPYYGWDNEYGNHQADIDNFEASRYLVSNGEFLDFVNAGGYQQSQYWSAEGQQWLDFAKARHPSFWIETAGSWQLRLMTDIVAMPWDWPAEVNYHEAKAFCHWLGEKTGQTLRLPSEDEWYRLYDFAGIEELVPGAAASANLHLADSASSCPVNRYPQGDLFDVVGNVWQWTETAIYPFNDFKVHPLYDDFTMPTFDGQHNLFKGGSWISCGNETRRSARYAFRKHFFQHAGFRYVHAKELEEPMASNYETDKMLSEYAEFHFGDRYFDVDNFSKALADLALGAMGEQTKGRALDIGCAVGRSSFELAEQFDHVTGIDFSARLINLAVQLQDQGVIRYSIADEGELAHYHERKLSDFSDPKNALKVDFAQGDACNLKPHYTGYDLVLAANLIDRLYQPSLFLGTIHERMNVGGVLLIASPYTWLEEHTNKEEWVGGRKVDGENVTTFEGLKAMLEPHFDLIQEPISVPFVIRETSRKFQHSLSEATLWRYRG